MMVVSFLAITFRLNFAKNSKSLPVQVRVFPSMYNLFTDLMSTTKERGYTISTSEETTATTYKTPLFKTKEKISKGNVSSSCFLKIIVYGESYSSSKKIHPTVLKHYEIMVVVIQNL